MGLSECMTNAKNKFTEEEEKLSQEVDEQMKEIMDKALEGLDDEEKAEKEKQMTREIFGFCPSMLNFIDFSISMDEFTNQQFEVMDKYDRFMRKAEAEKED